MNNIKSYNEFLNEGLLSNLFSKIKGYLSQGLQELMKDVKSGDPEKMIDSLKQYIQLNGKKMDEELKNIKDKQELKEYLHNTLYGIYSAIMGIKSTQKIEPVFFEDMFKNADENLIKLMNTKEKKFEDNLDIYLEKFLLPGLYKLSGISKDEITDEIPDKLKKSTKNWIANILSPILKMKNPKSSDKKNEKDEKDKKDKIIPTSDNSQVSRNTVQDMVKNATLDQIKNFRREVGKNKGITKNKDLKNRWSIGK